MTRRTFAIGLIAVLAAGAAVRMVGTDWGEPDGYHFDERFVLAPALRIVETGDPNPRFFNYPSALIYATTGIVWLHSTAGDMPLELPDSPAYGPADLGTWTWPALRDSRRLVSILGVLGILGAAWLAYRTGGREAALLAGVLVASLALHAEHSHFLTTDVPMTTILTFAFVLGARPGAGAAAGAASGAALGLAIATKYTAGFALVPILVVNALAGGSLVRVAAVVPGALVAFIAACPFALLDWSKFTNDLTIVRDHYRRGHLGAEGNGNWGWYLMRLRQEGLGSTGLGLLVLGLAGVLVDTIRPQRSCAGRDGGPAIALVIAATAIAWFGWLGLVRVRFERNLIPAVVLAAVASAHGLTALLSRLPARESDTLRGLTSVRSVCTGLLIVALAAPAALAMRRTAMLAGDDTRSQAAAWIAATLPAGSKIIREEYTPRPDPDRFDVLYVWSLAVRDPVWYRTNGVDYVVASSAIHGRFHGPGSFEAERYGRLFLWPKAASFVPGPTVRGPAVTVFKVPPLPPGTSE